MDNQRQVFELITALSGQGNIIAVPRLFIDFTGDINTALFLSQLLHLSDKGIRKDGFIWKSYKDWEREIGIKLKALNRCSKKLEGMGILETKIMKAMGRNTKHYRIKHKEFVEQITDFANQKREQERIEKQERIEQGIDIDYNQMDNDYGRNDHSTMVEMTDSINRDNNKDNNKEKIKKEILKKQEPLIKEVYSMLTSLFGGTYIERNSKEILKSKFVLKDGHVEGYVKDNPRLVEKFNRLMTPREQQKIANAKLSFDSFGLVNA